MKKMKVRIERLEKMYAVYTHVLSDTPEKDARRQIMELSKRKELLKKDCRLFGRNTYPTDKPEPHGYEYFLTIDPKVERESDIQIKEIPGGLYAVFRFQNLNKIRDAWQQLWKLRKR